MGAHDSSESLITAVTRTGHRLEVYAENVPDGLPPNAMTELMKGKPTMLRGSGRKDVTAFAFGAHLLEVRIDRLTRRNPRRTGGIGVSAGTIVNPLTAYSQFMGGAIWGLSSALLEETDLHQANGSLYQ